MKQFVLLCIVCYSIVSCKQNIVNPRSSYTIVVANAALGVIAQTNFKNSGVVAYNSRGIFYAESGEQVKISTIAFPNSDIYSEANTFQSGVYTLFLTGDSVTPQTLFRVEADLPFIPNDKPYSTADSVVNVRFANLSSNSVPLKIKLSTTTANEVDNLPYKEISNWRPFKATATTTNYIIQVRNAATDALITSYTFTANATNRFKNVTLMIRGLQGTTSGTNAFGVTPINYF